MGKENKKVLIITYYWPPSAGVGVQRWLKMSKYLTGLGYEPVVFTPENPDFNVKDDTLLEKIDKQIEVIRFPIWEPFGVFHKLTGGKKTGHVKQGIALEKKDKSLVDKVSVWIRGNIFIPDPRVFWVRPSVKFLQNIIEENGIKAIITTGPPHSMHLIGLKLKQKTGLPWIADFRDPWSHWDLMNQLKVSPLVHKIHRSLEQKVLKRADCVLTVSPQLAQDFSDLGKGRPVEVIYNGVDAPDLKDIPDKPLPLKKFKISHIGLMNEMRNPAVLWQALKELLEERPDLEEHLELYLAGIISDSIVASLKEDERLAKVLKVEAYISHPEVFRQCSESAIQLILLNNTDNARWILPVKMYEYLSVGRPVMLIGPEGSDASTIINGLNAGRCLGFSDKEAFKQTILSYYEAYLKKELLYQDNDISVYTRESQARKVAGLLDEIIPANE